MSINITQKRLLENLLVLLACAGILVGMLVSLSVLERRGTLVHKTDTGHNEEKLYSSYSRPHHLFTILLKDFNLFKITESIISFYFSITKKNQFLLKKNF